jgi:hypothetical protein
MHSMLWPMIATGVLELTVLTLSGAVLAKYLFFTTPAVVPIPIANAAHFAGASLTHRCQRNTGPHRVHLTDDR